MQNSKNIAEVVSHFKCAADADSYKAYGSGHINDTFLLKNVSAGGADYLLQRINHKVFPNVEKLIDNMRKVTEHLRRKVDSLGNGDPTKEVMTLIPTNNNQFYYQDTAGNYWRMFYFLSDTKSYDVVKTEKQAYEGGKAFGKFQAMLSDIPAGELYEVIPDFHNIQVRLKQLDDALLTDSFGRVATIAAELAIVDRYADVMQYFQQAEQAATLPKRVIHNDTKFNNVLLNSNDEAQCIIDLETVMDGYVAYDFGDAIRTIINTSTEDEADLGKIQLNLPLFNAYVRGYLKEASSFLTEAEINSLMKGALLLPYMQAVRFLTDHINGDIYFKTKFEGHNLQRARAQFQLLKLLDAAAPQMHETILKRNGRLQNSPILMDNTNLNIAYLPNQTGQFVLSDISKILDGFERRPIKHAPWSETGSQQPTVSFAIAYSSNNIYLKYYVTEVALKAEYAKFNDPVFEDSCVEFFIAFDDDQRYYNLEFNCTGNSRVQYGQNKQERSFIPGTLLKRIKHQTHIKNSTVGDIEWELILSIPKTVFKFHPHLSFERCKARVNFFKCGDALPEPHFLCWNKIEAPQPNFHLIDFFKEITFCPQV